MKKYEDSDMSLPYAFISVYEPVAGWKPIMYMWDEEFGSHAPWSTGHFAYKTREEAVSDAKEWAFAEEIPYLDKP